MGRVEIEGRNGSAREKKKRPCLTQWARQELTHCGPYPIKYSSPFIVVFVTNRDCGAGRDREKRQIGRLITAQDPTETLNGNGLLFLSVFFFSSPSARSSRRRNPRVARIHARLKLVPRSLLRAGSLGRACCYSCRALRYRSWLRSTDASMVFFWSRFRGRELETSEPRLPAGAKLFLTIRD